MGDGRLLSSLWIGFLPLIVALPVVLAASIIFGLPLTAFLTRRRLESSAAYTLSGAGLGFVIGLVALLLMRAQWGYWIGFLGGLSGAVTGRTWWACARRQLAADPLQPPRR